MGQSQIESFNWDVADLIRDTFERGKYQGVILLLTVLRRLVCVLADKKEKILARQAELRDKGLEEIEACIQSIEKDIVSMLREVAG